SSAQALARAPLDEVSRVLAQVRTGRWSGAPAQVVHEVARGSAASTRAVAARAGVVRTLALHLLDRHTRIAELEAALADLLRDDAARQQMQQIPGIGPGHAATLRADLGDVTRFSRVNQLIASAGLEPRTQDSGRYVGQKRLSKRGQGALR